jgi:actin related protein 2/3 complex subunit 3
MNLFVTDREDIIDEVLGTFRANIFFRNFDVRNSGDRTLIYLTLYVQQCLVKLEKIEDKASGDLNNLNSHIYSGSNIPLFFS